MTFSFLQLNIEEGKRIDIIESYLKEHSFDIIQFQEVTGGKQNFAGKDNFPQLLSLLGDSYQGVRSVYWRLMNDPTTYMSNATFFASSLTPVTTHTEFLKPYADLADDEMHNYADHPTCLLDVILPLNGIPVHCINTHLPWGPTPEDQPYKLEQGKALYDYVKSLTEPFVLSGDFNVPPDSQVIAWIDELGTNHSTHAGITNTLNPNTHRAQNLFPKGLAVDFLYTSPELKTANFTLIDTPDLSDHFGMSIEIEV